MIVIEGIDRVGKTTLKLKLEKQINYNEIVMDRGPISHMAYAIKFRRDDVNLNDIEYFKNSLIYFIDASNNIDLIKKRLVEEGDDSVEPDIDNQIFINVVDSLIARGFNIVKIPLEEEDQIKWIK